MHSGKEDSTAERDVCLSMHKVLSLSFQGISDHIASKIYMSFASNSSKRWFTLMDLSSLICVDHHLWKYLYPINQKSLFTYHPWDSFLLAGSFRRRNEHSSVACLILVQSVEGFSNSIFSLSSHTIMSAVLSSYDMELYMYSYHGKLFNLGSDVVPSSKFKHKSIDFTST